ncbi:DUF4920 domain-containing protein [Fodinibius sp. Rm-B-1B1-1]|uniref:DUF4920 domain-containing protein n=1 Tax=Fodinibius alkaliphilus TaxID=3140241 RepID=UPI003159A359
MKSLITTFVGLLLLVNVGIAQNKDAPPELAEPVESGKNYEVYGSEFPEEVKFFAPGYLVRNADVFKGQQIAARGEVKQVCQKKGCFFILPAGDQSIRVTFKDYKFFIPKDAAGQEVQLVGTFQVKDLSEEKAKHYAEDAGEDPNEVEGAQKEYGIVATSVKIIDTK